MEKTYTHEIVFEDTLKAAKEKQYKEHGSKSIYQGVYKYSKGKAEGKDCYYIISSTFKPLK